MIHEQKIITNYSPISSKGGKSRKKTNRKHKKNNKTRTRRRYKF